MSRHWPRRLAAVVLLLLPCGMGCDREPDARYGTVVGESLNGLSALVQVLRDAGHATTARRRLAHSMIGRYDVAIVLANGFGRPAAETRDILQRFLEADGPQTVLFVIRDSDAAVGYWQAVAAAPDLGPQKSARARWHANRTAKELRSDLETTFERESVKPAAFGYGLSRRAEAPPHIITVDLASARRSTAVRARWPLHRRLELPDGMRVLWRHAGEPLLASSGDGDRILLLASATPLLNAGLVDPGNRRLAAELAAAFPESSRVVVVGSAAVLTGEEPSGPSVWRLLAVQPHPWIACQAVIAIGLFCWWRFPIFGRPVDDDARRPQDFGHHIEALAALLRRSRAAGFARARLEAWERQHGRTEM